MLWITMSSCLRSCYSKMYKPLFKHWACRYVCVVSWVLQCVVLYSCSAFLSRFFRSMAFKDTAGMVAMETKRALHPIRFSQLSASSFSLWIWLPLERKLWCVVTPTTECILPQLSTGSTLFFFFMRNHAPLSTWYRSTWTERPRKWPKLQRRSWRKRLITPSRRKERGRGKRRESRRMNLQPPDREKR